MRKTVFFMLFLILVNACKKAEDRRCFKSIGPSSERYVYPGDFGQLVLKEHLTYTLVQDSVDYIRISGGKNLLNFVDCALDGDVLTIKNKNKCNFLRNYKKSKLNVEIHFKNIYNIDFHGSEPLVSKDTLQLNYLSLTILDGSSSVDLTLNSLFVRGTVAHGFGDFVLGGNVNYLELDVRSNGFCDTRNLKVKDSVTVVSRTVVDLKVNAANCKLKAETEMAGNIYYTGLPTSITKFEYGKGRVLPF